MIEDATQMIASCRYSVLMKSTLCAWVLALLTASGFYTQTNLAAQAGSPSAATKANKQSSTKTAATTPSDQEIADAKSKGLVWVNLRALTFITKMTSTT